MSENYNTGKRVREESRSLSQMQDNVNDELIPQSLVQENAHERYNMYNTVHDLEHAPSKSKAQWHNSFLKIKIMNWFVKTNLNIIFSPEEIKDAEDFYDKLSPIEKEEKQKLDDNEFNKKKAWFDQWGFTDFRMFSKKNKVIFNLLLQNNDGLSDINEHWFESTLNTSYIYFLMQSLRESPFNINLKNTNYMFNNNLLNDLANRDDLLFLMIFLSNFDNYHKIVDKDDEGVIYADNSFLNVIFDLGARSTPENRKKAIVEIAKLTNVINNIKIKKMHEEMDEEEISFYETSDNYNYYLTRDVTKLYNYIFYEYKKKYEYFEYENIIPIIHIVLNNYNNANSSIKGRNNLVKPENYYSNSHNDNPRPYIFYNYKTLYLETINDVLKSIEKFKRRHTVKHVSKIQKKEGGLISVSSLKTKIKKDVFGVMRCIYKISGSRLEHIKYNNMFVSLKLFRKEHLDNEKKSSKKSSNSDVKYDKKADKKLEDKSDVKSDKKSYDKSDKKSQNKSHNKKSDKKSQDKTDDKKSDKKSEDKSDKKLEDKSDKKSQDKTDDKKSQDKTVKKM